MLAGLVFTVLGMILTAPAVVPLRVICLLGGTLLAGAAVARRLQTMSWELEDRVESAGLLATAAFVGVLAYIGMDDSWDSGHTFYVGVILVSLVGSFLVMLPKTGRRIAAVVLLVMHFAGILTAVTSVPPRQEQAPWVPMMVWAHFYRHYLHFAYLTNAYHFYSPDPGPPTLLWFHVEYADGSARWIKWPNKKQSPVGLHHQRMLATAESAHNDIIGPTLPDEMIPQYEERFHRDYDLLPGVRHDGWQGIARRRQMAESLPFVDPKDDNRPAPLHMVRDENVQFAEPQEISRRLIASYARHIARTSPDPEDASNAVASVRVYRVVHDLISPREFHEGKKVDDPTTFKPFYMGKYDPDGRILDGGKWDKKNQRWIEPPDPFLFWYIPIISVPKRYPEPGTDLLAHMQQPGEQKIIDFVEIHATQSDKFRQLSDDK
jgi:hypothetical protein